MHQRAGRRILLIFIITVVATFVSLPSEFGLFGKTFYRRDLNINLAGISVSRKFDLKLGLDLVGGSRLVFEAETTNMSDEERDSALTSLREVMERRVNLFGVSEPSIQISRFEGRDRIVIELPGVTDTAQAVSLVGKTAELNFAEENAHSEEGFIPTDLTGADLKRAVVSFDQVSGKPVVVLEFTGVGGEKFAEITERNVGKSVPILLDGQLISMPVVQDKIIGGTAQISGEFSIDEAKAMVIQLNAGALPVPVNLVSERTVGASLGRESVEKSVKAGVMGLSMVLLFMALFYGRLGMVADVGLVIFGVITLALYKLIPVVLTLPGVAGFLLSVGMAVDSNILIFERFRDERKKGINVAWALETSFDRAWDSIKDANIATLLTAFVLANPLDWPFLHTSGPVRGFAITLALGIGVSFFTGIFVSRTLLRTIIGRGGKR